MLLEKKGGEDRWVIWETIKHVYLVTRRPPGAAATASGHLASSVWLRIFAPRQKKKSWHRYASIYDHNISNFGNLKTIE